MSACEPFHTKPPKDHAQCTASSPLAACLNISCPQCRDVDSAPTSFHLGMFRGGGSLSLLQGQGSYSLCLLIWLAQLTDMLRIPPRRWLEGDAAMLVCVVNMHWGVLA